MIEKINLAPFTHQYYRYLMTLRLVYFLTGFAPDDPAGTIFSKFHDFPEVLSLPGW
jgi:hypothetical protein